MTILRGGMQGDEFWPAIHAAEGLTLGGHGDEVIEYLTPKNSKRKPTTSNAVASLVNWFGPATGTRHGSCSTSSPATSHTEHVPRR